MTRPANIEAVLLATSLDVLLVRSLRQKLPLLPALQPLSSSQVEALALVLSEHLTNVLEHNSQPCQVSVGLSRQPKGLLIEDNGKSIAEQLAAVAADLRVPEPLQTSGRGLWLMLQSFPELEYQTSEQGNQLWLPLLTAKPRLVLIDDDPIQLALLNAWLQHDYQLEVFSDPVVALHFLKTQPVDLIISDIIMPVLDGLMLRQQLLNNPQTQAIPFLFVSSDQNDQLKLQAADLSIDDYICKPMLEASVKQAIRRVLNRSVQLRHSVDAQLDQALTRSLWQVPPQHWQGWDLQLAYLVASKGGGDFVFWQQREKSLLLVLGDVMGHGVPAKFFAFAFCGYLQGLCYALAAQRSPAELLEALSGAVYNHPILQQTLVTAVVLEIFADGQVLVASAGHPPPYLYSAQNGIAALNIRGMLPGLQPHARYEVKAEQLNSGDYLFAITDGLIEQHPDDPKDRESILQNSLSVLCSQNNGMTLNDFLHNLYEQPLPDDLTLLALRRV